MLLWGREKRRVEFRTPQIFNKKREKQKTTEGRSNEVARVTKSDLHEPKVGYGATQRSWRGEDVTKRVKDGGE